MIIPCPRCQTELEAQAGPVICSVCQHQFNAQPSVVRTSSPPAIQQSLAPGITLTDTMLVCPGGSYALKQIVSVHVISPRIGLLPIVAFIFGVLFLPGFFLTDGTVVGITGAVFLLYSIHRIIRGMFQRSVHLTTAGGTGHNLDFWSSRAATDTATAISAAIARL